eukprot:5230947-Prymnesium_polylepis.1
MPLADALTLTHALLVGAGVRPLRLELGLFRIRKSSAPPLRSKLGVRWHTRMHCTLRCDSNRDSFLRLQPMQRGIVFLELCAERRPCVPTWLSQYRDPEERTNSRVALLGEGGVKTRAGCEGSSCTHLAAVPPYSLLEAGTPSSSGTVKRVVRRVPRPTRNGLTLLPHRSALPEPRTPQCRHTHPHPHALASCRCSLGEAADRLLNVQGSRDGR